jgi:ElaB/YqjD/DUF883 family membrane-anchored ribosome-binding protein
MKNEPIADDANGTSDINFLRQQFERFRVELAGMKEKLSDDVSTALDEISSYLHGGELSKRAASVEADLAALSCKLQNKGKNAVSRLEHRVEERPLASVAVAFGVGLIAAQFLRRK